jgi:hypothetical protein
MIYFFNERMYEVMNDINDFVLQSDGSVVIPIRRDGLPSATAIAPLINYKPEQRLLEADNILNSYAMRGLFIEEFKWIRNKAFDRNGEKTTIQIKVRICKNENEAAMTANKIKGIIEKMI